MSPRAEQKRTWWRRGRRKEEEEEEEEAVAMRVRAGAEARCCQEGRIRVSQNAET